MGKSTCKSGESKKSKLICDISFHTYKDSSNVDRARAKRSVPDLKWNSEQNLGAHVIEKMPPVCMNECVGE